MQCAYPAHVSLTVQCPCRRHSPDDLPFDAFGFAVGSLSAHARTLALYVARMPALLSFEAACTLPIAWMTVHEAFSWATLGHGAAALVHAAAGGVGLVALEYAAPLSPRYPHGKSHID